MANNSTFYADGYQDGYKAEKCSPPKAEKVLADEYLQGYADGLQSAWVDAGAFRQWSDEDMHNQEMRARNASKKGY